MFHKTAPVFAPSWCCHCKHPDNRSDTVNQPLCQKFGMWAWPRFPQGPKKKTPDQNEEHDEKKHEVSVWACSIMTNSPWYAMCIYCLVCKNLGNLHSQRTQNLPPCPHHSGTQAWKEGHRETDTDRTGFEVLFETATWAFFWKILLLNTVCHCQKYDPYCAKRKPYVSKSAPNKFNWKGQNFIYCFCLTAACEWPSPYSSTSNSIYHRICNWWSTGTDIIIFQHLTKCDALN